MKDKFVHLHVHSSYSFTDGAGLPEQYIDRCKELGQPALAVTDHGNISAHYKWYKKCKNAGIIPILGCELYINATEEDLKQRAYNHITVLVKNITGYQNLMKLVTKSWTEQHYYKPRVTFQQLFDHQEGLIVLSGCLSSPVMSILKDKEADEADLLFKAENQLELFKKNIEHFYIEFQPITFEDGLIPYARLLKLYNETLKDKGFKAVVTNDCHYVHEDQAKLQEVMLCVQSKDTMDNPKHWKFDQEDFFLKTRQQMEYSMGQAFPLDDFSEELDETVRVSELIDFEFPQAEPIKFPMPEEGKIEEFKRQCYEGLVKRGLAHNLESGKQDILLSLSDEAKYKERLDYEIDLIIKKNFIDYFFVISDLINWAKSNGILVGPARGSAAGSLACYAMAITEVDPIKYGLIFQRFIDINREDLPDIDIDFEDARRHEVKEYLESKYGQNKVGNLPTFAVFQGKSAMDDIGRVFRIPHDVIGKVKTAIIERSGGDSRASFTLQDTFDSTVFTYPKEAMEKYPEMKYAIQIEGQIRQMGQHAAGVVISNEPLDNFCATYKVKDSRVISLEYKDASDIGLLKIDLLGLNTLSVISKCLRLIKQRTNKTINIYDVPLDDPKVYKAFIDGRLFGVFQFDGQAVNQVCRQIAPTDFESLSAISALARPGPLNSGNTTEYIQRKNGRAKVKYVHEIMKDITSDSYGIVIYQEQVMRIMREIGDMSWKDTSEIRKLISKSQGVEKFNTFKDKFIPGALGHGLSQEVADKIWEEMCSYGSWSFNKSHSVSYTLISYWTQWLKVYYPMEFYGSIMSLTKFEAKKKKIIGEYKKEGYKVLGIDINKSKESFSVEKEGLRVGFTDIKGIGPTTARRLVKNQPFLCYSDFDHLKARLTQPMKDALVNLGAFDTMEMGNGQVTLFGETIREFEKKPMEFSEAFRLCPWNLEFGVEERWGQFIRNNLAIFKQLPTNIAELKEREIAEEVVIVGIVYDKNLRDAREVSSSKGKDVDLSKYKICKLKSSKAKRAFKTNPKYVSQKSMSYREGLVEGKDYEIEDQFQFANFVLEDDTDFITVRLSHLKFPEYGNLIFEQLKADDVIIIKGRMGSGIRMFFADKILCLRKVKDKLEAKKE